MSSLVSAPSVSSEIFMTSILRHRYTEQFHARSPFRTMFESENYLVYFQNFNKVGTSNLWYRLSKSALQVLRQSKKTALVYFTNPAENIAYEIPIKDIDIQAKHAGWEKDFFEVNIDPANSRWRDMDWNIKSYFVQIESI